MSINSGITRRLKLTANSLVLWDPFFCNVSRASAARVFCRYVCWNWAPQFFILIGCSFLYLVSVCCKEKCPH